MGWGDGLDMYKQLEGGFGSMCAILTMYGLGKKMDHKLKNKKNQIELIYSIRLDELIILVWSNVKIG